MGWVTDALRELELNGMTAIRPHGGSMRGRIESGQLVTLQAVPAAVLAVDDAALVRWKGNYLLHLIKEERDGQFLIGNNLGRNNGWIPQHDAAAKVVRVED